MTGDGWSLDDAESLSAAAPRSFFIPSIEERGSLAMGRLVKLVFRSTNPRETRTERMWVEVTTTLNLGRYHGILSNSPALSFGLDFGDSVEFGPEHVVAIYYDVAELGYQAAESAYVDGRVRLVDQPPDMVVRAPASPEGASTWFATIDGARPDDTITLGELTDRWPGLAEPFRVGDGAWALHKAGSSWHRVDLES